MEKKITIVMDQVTGQINVYTDNDPVFVEALGMLEFAKHVFMRDATNDD